MDCLAEIDASSVQFHHSGYLILPGFLPDDLSRRLMPEADRWVDEGWRTRGIASCLRPEYHGPPPMWEFELAAHGELVAHEPLLRLIGRLMGGSFVFHHLHSDRHGTDTPAKSWHHDYEPNESGDRSLLMLHALHYPGGLEPSQGSLVVLPGSHRTAGDKAAPQYPGTITLPGEVVVDRLPPGSTLLLHSALVHARRTAAGGSDRPRYFIDASYCQAGARWSPVKPHWREMLKTARDLGLDGGKWPHLFAEEHFREYAERVS